MIDREEKGGRIVYDVEEDRFLLEACVDWRTISIDRALSAGCLITSKCNVECAHCYGNDESLPAGQLSVQKWRAIFGHLWELGFRRVDLSGGEPTLRRDLPEIVAAAREAGLAVVISTNGMRPAESLITSIPKDVRIHVSIDGSTAAVHEGNRVRHDGRPSIGSFATVCAFIRSMTRAGFRVRVLTAVGRHNIDDIAATGEMLAILGVTDWNISMVLRAGRAIRQYEEQWVVDTARVFEQVTQVRAAFPEMRIGYSDRTEQDGYFVLVLNDGTMATQFTDGTDKHVIGPALDVTMAQLVDHPELDLDAHTAKWIAHTIACQRVDCSAHSDAPATAERSNAAVWIDDRTAAVGRLDGTMVIAREEDGAADVWQISALSEPVEMIASIGRDRIVSSYGPAALALWLRDGGNFVIEAIVAYPEEWGTACAGFYFPDRKLLISGHHNGFLCIWQVTAEGAIPLRSTNMRSGSPVASTAPMWDIRSIDRWRESSVVTGSEDGDLCVVDIDSGSIIHRQRYNARARRGINSVSICNDFMLVGNCAVGRDDSNVWLYRIEEGGSFTLLDSSHLIASPDGEQAYGFNVQLVEHEEGPRFFISTEEGLMWTGRVVENRLLVTGSRKLEAEGGLVLAPALDGRLLLAAGRELHLLDIREL